MVFVGHRIVHHLDVSNISRTLRISFAAASAGLDEDETPSQSNAHSSSSVAVANRLRFGRGIVAGSRRLVTVVSADGYHGQSLIGFGRL